MDKRIRFGDKQKLNKLRQEDFLKLTGGERVLQFFKLIQWSHQFYGTEAKINPDNFIIDLTRK